MPFQKENKLGKLSKGKKLTIEQKKKISETLKRKHKTGELKSRFYKGMSKEEHPMFGKTCPERVKQAISKAQKGKPKSKEHREKLSRIKKELFRKGILKPLNYWKGKKMSSTIRKNMSLAAARRIEREGSATIGKNEKKILDFAEKVFGYKIERQYRVGRFFLDGYIPEINIAIEVDEKSHKNQFVKDYMRELDIRKVLNCEFIRISEEAGLNAIKIQN